MPISSGVVVVSVDGQASTDPTLGQRRVVSGIGRIFSAVSGGAINAYNFETLLLAQQQVAELVKALRILRCDEGLAADGYACDDVEGSLVHVSLDSVADPVRRARLQSIRTGLTIPDADVDALVAEGETLIRTNPALLELLADFDAKVPLARR